MIDTIKKLFTKIDQFKSDYEFARHVSFIYGSYRRLLDVRCDVLRVCKTLSRIKTSFDKDLCSGKEFTNHETHQLLARVSFLFSVLQQETRNNDDYDVSVLEALTKKRNADVSEEKIDEFKLELFLQAEPHLPLNSPASKLGVLEWLYNRVETYHLACHCVMLCKCPDVGKYQAHKGDGPDVFWPSSIINESKRVGRKIYRAKTIGDLLHLVYLTDCVFNKAFVAKYGEDVDVKANKPAYSPFFRASDKWSVGVEILGESL